MKKRAAGTARDGDSLRLRYAGITPFIETALDVDAIALSDPAQYRRLLDGFFLLLGERRLWWERCAEAEDSAWQTHVRAAIIETAAPTGWTPARLADLLDLDGSFPKTKVRILRLARERFYRVKITP